MQIDFDSAMSIDASARNEPMRQQRLANMICYKWIQKGHSRKNYPNPADNNPSQDHNT